MQNTNADNDYIKISYVDTSVRMQESKLSRTTIGTDSLITCFCFIIDFSLNDEAHCILEHHTSPLDESTMSSSEIIICYLHHIWSLLKSHLGDALVVYDQNRSTISNISLLLSGGCVNEGIYIRNAFLIFNLDNIHIINENYMNKEILCLYNQLKNNVMILQPMTKMLKHKEKKKR